MANATHEVLTGICSCCLGRFVVEGQRNVKHGYKRPGDGHEHGECMGLDFPCYEVSTEGCVWMRDGLLRGAEAHRTCASQLSADQVETIYREKRVYDPAFRRYDSVLVAVTRDSDAETFRSVGSYDWTDLRKREEERHLREAKAQESQAQIYQKYIDAWKPGLEFISEDRLNAEKQEIRDAKAADARRKRIFKAMKAAFFHIGAAISKHKKGWLHAEWEWEQMYIRHNSTTSARYADLHRLPEFGEMYPQYAKKRKSR